MCARSSDWRRRNERTSRSERPLPSRPVTRSVCVRDAPEVRGHIAHEAVGRNTPPHPVHSVATTSVPRRSRRRGCAAPGLPEGAVYDGSRTEWTGRLDTPKETARCPGFGATRRPISGAAFGDDLADAARHRRDDRGRVRSRARPCLARAHGPTSTHAGCRRAVLDRRGHASDHTSTPACRRSTGPSTGRVNPAA